MASEDMIEKEIQVIPSTGLYKSSNDFLKDAVNTLLGLGRVVRGKGLRVQRQSGGE